jgi:hypothetical protein
MKHSHAMEINNSMQLHGKEHPASQEYLERIIEELRKDIADREDAIQRALAGIRADITDLYSFYKSHKCWVV